LQAFAQEPKKFHPFEFSDFGVRRRFSGVWHDEVIATLTREVPEFFKGTSNVYLAKKHQVVPMGTMAHEYLQSYQSFGVRLRDFQKAALEDWVQEYRGDLGIALTDVVGMDAFLLILICILPSCLMVCGTIPAILSSGAKRRWRIMRNSESTVKPSDWCFPMHSILILRSEFIVTLPIVQCLHWHRYQSDQ
jgi:hypothetical protein